MGGGMAPTTTIFLEVLGTNEHVSYVWEASGVGEEVAQVKMEGRARWLFMYTEKEKKKKKMVVVTLKKKKKKKTTTTAGKVFFWNDVNQRVQQSHSLFLFS